MKTALKKLTALAAVAGVVFVIATFGDKIVAWAKKLLGKCECNGECKCECVEESAVEEVVAEEAVAEDVVEEVPVEEVVVDAAEPVAEEADFEG